MKGFRGFDHMRRAIYTDCLARISIKRTGSIGAVVVIAYPPLFEYGFGDGRALTYEGRISQAWERRDDRFVIVHEHPSAVDASLER